MPGHGIDFTRVGSVLLLRAGAVRGASLLHVVPGLAAQRRSCSARSTGCASDVEDKLNRLPLSYFDGQPRGEVLSRVTNDIDNIAQTPAADA